MKDQFLTETLIRHEGRLFMEAVELDALIPEFGTPYYAYSRRALVDAFQEHVAAFSSLDPLICYAVKANGNLAILRILAQLGAGFDIVSRGELERVLRAGGDSRKVVFSGVGKSVDEIEAALQAGILCFNIESEAELERIDQIAQVNGVLAPISLRINPAVDPKTHPYIATGLRNSKFGIPHSQALALYQTAADLKGIRILGVDCHIGSQITELPPFIEALDRTLELVDQLEAEGIDLHHIDLGGGVGIRYRDEKTISLDRYAKSIEARLSGFKGQLLLEPGRRIVGNCGVLVTRIEYLKTLPGHRFAIVDAAMNDLIRPALYRAWHEIVPLIQRNDKEHAMDIVGPVCESGDVLGRRRRLAVRAGDGLAILSAGAYGSSMGSQYNSRPRPPELLIDGSVAHLIRRRESFSDLIRCEDGLPSV